MRRLLLCLGLLLGLSACAHSPSYDPADPLERINRPIFAFNLKADHYVLRPVTKTYVKLVPDAGRRGVDNFLTNLFYPTTIVNDVLQAKFKQGGQDVLRFVMNTTIGLAGFLDVASGQGLSLHNEDLGQTFGRWGVGEGWYLMIPLLGPSDNRDLIGRIGDEWTMIPTYVNGFSFFPDTLGLDAAVAVNNRVDLLGTDKTLSEQLDQYVFVRTAYLDHRQDLVYDGHPPEEDPGFDDTDDGSAADADAAKKPAAGKPADGDKKKTP